MDVLSSRFAVFMLNLLLITALLNACTPNQIEPIEATRLATMAVAPTLLPPTTTAMPTATAVPPTATLVLTATTTAVPTPTPFIEEATKRWINPIYDVTIYSGPGREFAPSGILATGSAARVIAETWDDWIPIECPAGGGDSCWVQWDYNTIYSYEGAPITLTIPDPASLKIESTSTTLSPNGRWQAQITRSESVLLGGDAAWFFYVELKVTSLEDGTTWTSVSEWHVAGIGEEGPPRLFHWSLDGRYLYYTSTHDYHAACAVYDNIGDAFGRLDLSNGQVAFLPPPQPRGILTFSADETWMAYLSGPSLVIREVATAYAEPSESSVKWQVPLNYSWNAQISSVAWSPDNKKVLVTADHRLEGCDIAGTSSWELDVATGILTPITEFVPTPEPTPIPCAMPEPKGTTTRDSYLIFCGGHDNISFPQFPERLINGDALTFEAYVNYLGDIEDRSQFLVTALWTFNMWFAQNKIWFCLLPRDDTEGREGKGEWVCLSHGQPETGRWVHTAVTWDGQEITLFYDGVLQAQTAFAGTLFLGPADWLLTIGNGCVCPDSFEGFHGYIDEVRISSISRYEADFEPQHQFTTDEFTVGLWHFDEGQGTVVADASDHENDGTLSPFVRWGAQQ